MRCVRKYYSRVFVVLALLTAVYLQNAAAQSVVEAVQMTFSPQEKQVIADFEKAANDYSELREFLEDKLPKLSKEATPEEIDAHKKAFQKSVLEARKNARQGTVFTPAAQAVIRRIIKEEFKGRERVELRETVMEAENKGVPLKVNYPYPEEKESLEMPPTLLVNLPQLPKQLRYRFVGRNLMLVDRENKLIVDYMTNALP